MHDFLDRVCGRMTPNVRGLALMATIALMLPLNALSTLEAEPVTFAFDAEITSINRSPDATFDLPSNVVVGDTLSGLLEFEPFGFGLNVGVSDLKVNLGTEVFSAEGAPITPSIGILSADPTGLYLVRDAIAVGCKDFSSCAALLSSSNDLELVGLELDLLGEIVQSSSMSGLITVGESLGDPDVWNRLLTRLLRMDFTSNSGPGSIQLEAAIGSMVAIPEPSSLMLILIGVFGLARYLSRCK